MMKSIIPSMFILALLGGYAMAQEAGQALRLRSLKKGTTKGSKSSKSSKSSKGEKFKKLKRSSKTKGQKERQPLESYVQWREADGYWIGEYSFYQGDGTPNESATFNYPYGAYRGFVTSKINEYVLCYF
jgi:hypothetical protein